MRYFLFMIFRDATEKKEMFGVEETITYRKGQCGVGKTSLPVSMAEYPQVDPFGIMYVIDGSYLEQEAIKRKLSPYALTADQIKDIVLSFWIKNETSS